MRRAPKEQGRHEGRASSFCGMRAQAVVQRRPAPALRAQTASNKIHKQAMCMQGGRGWAVCGRSYREDAGKESLWEGG